MAAKVIRISASAAAEDKTQEHEHDHADPSPASSEGWDPFEVWRTRVLAPRLEESVAPEPVRRSPPRRGLFSLLRCFRKGR